MNYITALKCVTYLKSLGVDYEQCEYVYREYEIDDVKNKETNLNPGKKSVRILINVRTTDLSKYIHVMKIEMA
jgi:hypothetical protein